MKKKCIITGANSFVAKYLKNQFVSKNWQVILLSSSKYDENYFNLKEPNTINSNIFKNTDLLIHCAYDFKLTRWEDIFNTNVIGSFELFKIANKYKVKKIINISTLSAFENAKSIYGKAKYLIEQKSKHYNVINIRCGLFNDKNSKIFSKFLWISNKLKICPMIGNGKYYLHICNLKYLFEEIIYLINLKKDLEIYYSGTKRKYYLKDIIKFLSNDKIIFVYIPLSLITLILKLFGYLRISLGFNYDNLLGLINYNDKIEIDDKSKHSIYS